MRKEYAGVAEFAYVYIKEAHPEDEWQMDDNVEDKILYTQPTTFEERLKVARAFVDEMGVESRTLVDDIRNTANACYAASPERIYVIGTDGRIMYKGGMGPFYFEPEEVKKLLDEHNASKSAG